MLNDSFKSRVVIGVRLDEAWPKYQTKANNSRSDASVLSLVRLSSFPAAARHFVLTIRPLRMWTWFEQSLIALGS
jgi:hypothetical protein